MSKFDHGNFENWATPLQQIILSYSNYEQLTTSRDYSTIILSDFCLQVKGMHIQLALAIFLKNNSDKLEIYWNIVENIVANNENNEILLKFSI